MSETHHAVIPFESLDPLTIGAADNEDLVYRETIEVDIPTANLMADIRPEEPDPIEDVTATAAAALENPHSGPRFSDLLEAAGSVAVVIDNQFRPTPTSGTPCRWRTQRRRR